MIKNKYIHYDHKADKKDLQKRWSKEVKVKLQKVDDQALPQYLVKNKEKYFNWFDN